MRNVNTSNGHNAAYTLKAGARKERTAYDRQREAHWCLPVRQDAQKTSTLHTMPLQPVGQALCEWWGYVLVETEVGQQLAKTAG